MGDEKQVFRLIDDLFSEYICALCGEKFSDTRDGVLDSRYGVFVKLLFANRGIDEADEPIENFEASNICICEACIEHMAILIGDKLRDLYSDDWDMVPSSETIGAKLFWFHDISPSRWMKEENDEYVKIGLDEE